MEQPRGTADPGEQSPLLRLPAGLRLQIYSHVFGPNTRHTINCLYTGSGLKMEHFTIGAAVDISLLRVCRQIHQEALLCLQSKQALIITAKCQQHSPIGPRIMPIQNIEIPEYCHGVQATVYLWLCLDDRSIRHKNPWYITGACSDAESLLRKANVDAINVLIVLQGKCDEERLLSFIQNAPALYTSVVDILDSRVIFTGQSRQNSNHKQAISILLEGMQTVEKCKYSLIAIATTLY